MRRPAFALAARALVAPLAGVTLALAALPALADRALLIGLPDDSPLPAALRRAGFDVMNAPADRVSDMRSALSGLLSAADPGERRLIVMSGAFVHDGGDVWLLQRAEGAAPDRGNVGDVALSVDTALAVAAEAPGAAFVALGARRDITGPELGRGLQAGLVPPADIPQGVTVLHGAQADMARLFARPSARGADGLGPALRPGAALPAAVAGASGVTAMGYLPRDLAIRPAVGSPDAADASPADPEEQAAWERARDADTRAAYRAYLQRHPRGPNAGAARAAIADIETDPARLAEEREADLELDRQQRRRIQSQLTILGHEPQGVDGLFGPNTRAAIARFQRANGFAETGYLTREQIDTLSVSATQRQAELEAEAQRRRIQAEREDRAVWQATGAEGDEAGLRTYLQRYPDGLFAEEAREALAAIEADRRAAAEAEDTAAWERALGQDSVDAYRAYLDQRPEGAFAGTARARIEELRQQAGQDSARAEARRAEAQLGLNDVTRLLVERRLSQLGLEPGAADGRFDEATRRAIRAFQRDRGLPPTGYLSQQTLARMLADLGGILIDQ